MEFKRKPPLFRDRQDNNNRKIKRELTVLGYHALYETLSAGRTLKYIAISENGEFKKRRELINICHEKKVPVRILNRAEMEKKYPKLPHHGFIGELKSSVESIDSLEGFISELHQKNILEKTLIVLLDGVSDQQNLGAMMRSCHFFGVDLMIFEIKNSAPVDHLTHRASAGASLKQPFFWTEKLSGTLEILKNSGFEIIGAVTNSHPKAQSYRGCKMKKPSVLILGSEENGLRPHVLRFCDELITIDTVDGERNFDSLNVSVSLGVLLAQFAIK